MVVTSGTNSARTGSAVAGGGRLGAGVVIGGRRAVVAVALEAGPGVAEGDLIGGGEVLEEESPDALVMGAAGGVDHVQAGVGELRVEASAVGGVGVADEVALVDEAVDQVGAAAAAEQDGLGDLGHAHAVLWRVGEEHENFVGGERESVLGVHLGVELLGDAGVRFEHSALGGEFVPGEGGVW